MLCKFRRIAKARSEEELKNAYDYWKRGDENLVNWSKNQWIPLIMIYKTHILAAIGLIAGKVYISHINFYII